VRVNGRDSKVLGVRVGVYQGTLLNKLLLFVIEGLPLELLYADDLDLMAKTEELLVEKIKKWKKIMEDNVLRVNLGKTNVMKCEARFGPTENLVKWPCVCSLQERRWFK